MTTNDDWCGDWQTAEEEVLRSSLLATPEQRLAWLEEALRFAAKMRALRIEQNEK